MNARARNIRSRARRAAGFSLIEVLIAMVVFAVGVLGLAMVIPAGSNRVGRAGQQTRASQIAAMRAEQLLTTVYDGSNLDAGNHVDAENPYDGAYYVQWDVEEDAPLTGCKRVTVRVSRNSTSGASEARVVIVVPESGGM